MEDRLFVLPGMTLGLKLLKCGRCYFERCAAVVPLWESVLRNLHACWMCLTQLPSAHDS